MSRRTYPDQIDESPAKRLRRLTKDGGFYVSWRHASTFADELSDLLMYAKSEIADPKEGLHFTMEFFRSDERVFEMADDSSGFIGDVFRRDALELFAFYANQFENKSEVIDIVIDLMANDDYGARDNLVGEAHKFLSRSELLKLFEIVRAKELAFSGSHNPWSWMATSLAAQLKDGPLFESLMNEHCDGKPNGKILVQIASVYFESENFEKAQELIDRVRSDDDFAAGDKLELQKRIFEKLDKTDELANILIRAFKAHYSKHTLSELLNVVGEDQKEKICRSAIEDIMGGEKWDEVSAEFLIYCDAIDEAEKYILKNTSFLDGDRYYLLLPLAEAMDEKERYLAATMIYRALIMSVLRRANSKNYHHAADYFKRINFLSAKVHSWDRFQKHKEFAAELKEIHGKKSAFWAQIEDED